MGLAIGGFLHALAGELDETAISKFASQTIRTCDLAPMVWAVVKASRLLGRLAQNRLVLS